MYDFTFEVFLNKLKVKIGHQLVVRLILKGLDLMFFQE